MRILVCVKEVPDLDPETELTIDREKAWIKSDEHSRYMMNRFDEYAVEEAIRLKEEYPDSSIDAITVGPERAHMVLRRAMGMGADQGIHILTEKSGYISPFTVSSWIAQVVAAKTYDLVLTGVMSEDTQQAQTGVMLAQHLSMPWATSVIKQELVNEGENMVVEREIEGGFRDVLELEVPCLLTIQSGINQPRYPSLSKVLRAKKAELEIVSAADLEPEDNRQEVIEVAYPQKQREGRVLEGSQEEKARQLLDLFVEKAFI